MKMSEFKNTSKCEVQGSKSGKHIQVSISEQVQENDGKNHGVVSLLKKLLSSAIILT